MDNSISAMSQPAEFSEKPQVMTDAELKEALKVPPRDEKEYPMPSKEDMTAAGAFMYKLNLLAGSSTDGNLNALVWELYVKLNEYLMAKDNDDAIPLARAIADLKSYLAETDYMIFGNLPKAGETGAEKAPAEG